MLFTSYEFKALVYNGLGKLPLLVELLTKVNAKYKLKNYNAMDRYFKITANDAGANHEVIIKKINAFQAVDNVNINVDFIAKVVECDERGQELNAGEKQCNLPVVSQQRELLKFFAEQLRPSLEIDIGFNYITEDDIEECLKNFNCG